MNTRMDHSGCWVTYHYHAWLHWAIKHTSVAQNGYQGNFIIITQQDIMSNNRPSVARSWFKVNKLKSRVEKAWHGFEPITSLVVNYDWYPVRWAPHINLEKLLSCGPTHIRSWTWTTNCTVLVLHVGPTYHIWRGNNKEVYSHPVCT